MTSREQFEAWAHRKAVESGYQFLSFLLVKNDDGSYQTTWVDSAWHGWSASRQHLEVQLPETEYFGDSWSGGYAITRENVVDALEEQGLKVAP